MQTVSLFDSSAPRSESDRHYARFVVGADPSVVYYRSFLDQADAARYFGVFVRELAWRQEAVMMYGKRMPVPRLTAWFADPGVRYTYSNLKNSPMSWTPELIELRSTVESFLQKRFNSVLLNRYRDGNDSVAWHSDDETELGDRPLIASVSLGCSRLFRLRDATDRRARGSVELESGSLLVMSGDSQRAYQHCVPKEHRPVGERINLTFRITGKP
ncbi:MAG: alpha-ketoglutarate-dependent dioxygenase AlkB [Candidatus Eremiobacteraeota bacterium]|nr:alpha-ketoglutarate-dependent dioxygenase AlkB [Candidatus Eremiobacteraeota bacterium]